MTPRVVRDLSGLPTFGFGSLSRPWWGTLAFIGLEGTAFGLAIGTYLYLYGANPQWPLDAPPPNHWPGTLITLLLLASVWPNHWTDAVARAQNLRRARVGLVLMSLIAIVAVAIRGFEFFHLNVSWDQ